jgi:hypothetical protein
MKQTEIYIHLINIPMSHNVRTYLKLRILNGALKHSGKER